MKKQILYLFLLLGISTQAQWTLQNSGTTENLNDVYCISADTVVVVGNNGTILRTTNGGTDWLSINNPATENLHKVEFADTQTGYAIGDNGTVLKTTDAGVSWQLLTTTFPEDILYVSCTPTSVFISGKNGMLYQSTDAGNTWTNIPTGLTDDLKVKMTDDNTGYVLISNQIYKTIDGGYTWNPISWTDGTLLYDVQGNNSIVIFESNSTFSARLTQDAFQSFQSIDTPMLYGELIKLDSTNSFWLPTLVTSCMVMQPVIGKYDISNNEYSYCDLTDLLYQSQNYVYFTAIDVYNETTYVIGVKGMIIKNPIGTNCNNYVNSIKDYNRNQIKLYPNPNKGNFIIDTNLKITSYKIIDIQGNSIINMQIHQKEIDVSSLQTGIYFLQLFSEKEVYTQKLIIQK